MQEPWALILPLGVIALGALVSVTPPLSKRAHRVLNTHPLGSLLISGVAYGASCASASVAVLGRDVWAVAAAGGLVVAATWIGLGVARGRHRLADD